MRVCRYCGEENPLEEYEIANIIKRKKYRRWKCHKCYMDTKSIRKQKIKNWWNNFKSKCQCKICGENKFYMLDLHHRDPSEKEANLGQAIASGWSKERILKEAKKCDIYCANHHRELHHKEKLTVPSSNG